MMVGHPFSCISLSRLYYNRGHFYIFQRIWFIQIYELICSNYVLIYSEIILKIPIYFPFSLYRLLNFLPISFTNNAAVVRTCMWFLRLYYVTFFKMHLTIEGLSVKQCSTNCIHIKVPVYIHPYSENTYIVCFPCTYYI